MFRSTLRRSFAALLALALASGLAAQARSVTSPRIYVFDGGVLASETARYRLTDADVEEVPLSVASYLIVHPRGVLMWDAGAVADRERSGDVGHEQRLLRRDGQERFVKLAPTLTSQLRSAGYAPSDVTHLALSHYHWDHTADANLFAAAQWLVPKLEHDAMFRADPPGGTRPETYSALESNSRTTLLTAPETRRVRRRHRRHPPSARPHRRSHGAVRQARQHGRRRALGRSLPLPRRAHAAPLADVRGQRSRYASGARELEQFLRRTNAALWIRHDLVAHRKLKKAPEYYD